MMINIPARVALSRLAQNNKSRRSGLNSPCPSVVGTEQKLPAIAASLKRLKESEPNMELKTAAESRKAAESLQSTKSKEVLAKVAAAIASAVEREQFSCTVLEILPSTVWATLESKGYTLSSFFGDQREGSSTTISW